MSVFRLCSRRPNRGHTRFARGRSRAVLPALFVVAAVSLLGCISAWPASAWAAPAKPTDERSVLLEEGRRQRRAGDEAAALRAFRRAHALAPSPESFALMAAAECNLNRPVEAEPHLIAALGATGDPWITRHRAELEKLLALVKSLLGWVEITGSPVGAEVEVAGRAVGRLPLAGPLRVPAGATNVRVAAEGHEVVRRDVDISADETAPTRIRIDLPRRPVEAVRPTAPTATATTSAASTLASPASDHAGGGHRMAGFVVAGGAVALAATGVAALLVRQSSANAFNEARDPISKMPQCNRALSDAGGGPCQRHLDRGASARVAAYAAFAGAGLAAVISGILLSADSAPARDEPAPHARLSLRAPRVLGCGPALTEDNLGAGCHFSF